MTDQEELIRVLDDWRQTCFRLESLDEYNVEQEAARLGAYLRGEPVRPYDQGQQEWLEQLRREQEQGKRRGRVHAIAGPLMARLDARLLVGAHHQIAGVQAAALPDALVEAENDLRLGAEVRVAGVDPTAIPPGLEGVLGEDALDRAQAHGQTLGGDHLMDAARRVAAERQLTLAGQLAGHRDHQRAIEGGKPPWAPRAWVVLQRKPLKGPAPAPLVDPRRALPQPASRIRAGHRRAPVEEQSEAGSLHDGVPTGEFSGRLPGFPDLLAAEARLPFGRAAPMPARDQGRRQ